jgi:hypothetical protein
MKKFILIPIFSHKLIKFSFSEIFEFLDPGLKVVFGFSENNKNFIFDSIH